MNCLDSTIPSKSHFFNLHDSSLCRRHVNAASRKSLEIQAYSISKPRTLLKRKFLWKLVFSCSNTSWKSNLGRIDSFSRLNFSDAMWKPAIVRFIILVGKNRSSLLFVQFPVFFFFMSLQIFLYQGSALLEHRVYGKRQTWSNLFHVTKISIYLSFTVDYNCTKIGKFTQIISITIVLGCFCLLISYFENSQLESHVCRL